jgi:YD repeat-containing protein
MRSLLISVSVIALMVPFGAGATETVTYTYDTQGRLVQSVISGTVNNGQTNSTTFDAANNRTIYNVSVNGSAPPPPPSNQPPTTAADTMSVARCNTGTKNVTANDSDPEGHLPLSLVSVVNNNPSRGTASVLSASLVRYDAAAIGTDIITYTVKDSLGATSAGTLTVTITSGSNVCVSIQKGAPPPTGDGG